jgi:hypothetical protein
MPNNALTLKSDAPRLAPIDTAPLDFAGLVTMGDQLTRTGFLPPHIKTGAQVAAIVMTGRELGMTPMRALRSLVMVKGKVTEAADSMLARFKSDGGRATFRALDETQAVLWLRHPNGDEHTEVFSLADAKRAGIAGEMYSKYPKAMLRSRAITAGLKSLGWEGGSGVYDPSELDAPVDAADVIPEPEPLVVPEAVSDKQRALLERLAQSSTLTERERERLLAVSTRAQGKIAIDWATATIAARKTSGKGAPVEVAGDAQDVDYETIERQSIAEEGAA